VPEDFGGHFHAPVLVTDADPSSEIVQEEVFGPVLTVQTYDEIDEGIALADGVPYGLAGGVWADDDREAERVARRLRIGQVDINGGRYNPLAPFGGFKASGHGREMGIFGLEDFLEPQSLQL
jgi:acyl-CoA reductase-like NAD-dependent aldehyde dehydrogenase